MPNTSNPPIISPQQNRRLIGTSRRALEYLRVKEQSGHRDDACPRTPAAMDDNAHIIKSQDTEMDTDEKDNETMSTDQENNDAVVPNPVPIPDGDADAYMRGWPPDLVAALKTAHQTSRERERAAATDPQTHDRVYVVTAEAHRTLVIHRQDGTSSTGHTCATSVVGAFPRLEAASRRALGYFRERHLGLIARAPFFEDRKRRRGEGGGVLYENGVTWFVDRDGCLVMAAMDAEDGEVWDADVYRVAVSCCLLDRA